MSRPNYARLRRKSPPRPSKYDHITADVLQQMRDRGQTVEEMAQELGIPFGTTAWLLKRHKLPPVTRVKTYPATKEQLEEMRGKKMTVSEMAEALGTSRTTISRLISMYELPRIGKGTRRSKNPDPVKPQEAIVLIPEDFEIFIRGNYGKMTRGELAKRLGVDKVMLNRMIIQLGLGR